MRLFHVKELRLEEFLDDNIPEYAILSHRWGREEVSYQDFLAGYKKDGAGDKKILECCAYVAADIQFIDIDIEWTHLELSAFQKWEELISGGWVWVDAIEWVWIDTCCIDKSSSTELSEAINSMYHWYAGSRACYAYLSDVTHHEDTDRTSSKFRRSLWFSRGWTLQELLAPKNVTFLDTAWRELGTRSSLVPDIAAATGIAEKRLEDLTSYRPFLNEFAERYSLFSLSSVVERLSWAASRSTTRVEDLTYCLLGLMGLNMPLLYGEHNKAFQRLQLEIIRSTNDESVFLWHSVRHSPRGSWTGLLADHLFEFRSKHSLTRCEFSKINGLERPLYSVTNQGLELQVPAEVAQRPNFLLPLNCQHYEGAALKGAYAIHIEKEVSSGLWWRSHPLDHLWVALQDESVYSLDPGLFVVPIAWVWSRADLAKEGSEMIYAQINWQVLH